MNPATLTTCSWTHDAGIVELVLHRLPCNEIGSATLDDLEQFARFVESGADGRFEASLERMDAEADQSKDLGLTLLPSEYWRRQMAASFQDDRTGIENVDRIGVETLMWGADFPHPDGTWPDSLEFIDKLFAGVPETTRRKILYENAARLYDFPLHSDARD